MVEALQWFATGVGTPLGAGSGAMAALFGGVGTELAVVSGPSSPVSPVEAPRVARSVFC